MPMKYIKNEDGLFVCPHCNVTKQNQNTMHYHMKKHEEITNYVCKSCKKGFLQKQTLDLHIKSRHPELLESDVERKFKCPFDNCEFSALTKGNCIIHCLRVHFNKEVKDTMYQNPDTKMIECSECNNEFNSVCSFYYHCKGCMIFNENDAKYQVLKALI